MKKILIPEQSENMLHVRANLHCHSTVSDGRKTPEQLVADYKAHGYQVLCLTDHEIFVPHNNLSTDDFLLLNGFEFSINGDGCCCHLCLIAKQKDNRLQPCYHRTKYVWDGIEQYRKDILFDETKLDFEREYTGDCINEVIRQGKENGFFVTYNHPTWSRENYPRYIRYKGMDAMEIVNFGCVIMGYDDDNGHCYEDFLFEREKTFAIATDDNHNVYEDDDPKCDSYGGYTVIATPKLQYEAVTKALSEGIFYASTGNYKQSGPAINFMELTDDKKLKIKTSGAYAINFISNRIHSQSKVAQDGTEITNAEFSIPDDIKWFRLTVLDNRGFKAYTNAYFIKDLV